MAMTSLAAESKYCRWFNPDFWLVSAKELWKLVQIKQFIIHLIYKVKMCKNLEPNLGTFPGLTQASLCKIQ